MPRPPLAISAPCPGGQAPVRPTMQPQETSVILASPTPQKQRGAFYTPRSIAEFLVRWAIRSPVDHVLDPSCGEAVFLDAAIARINDLDGHLEDGQVIGCEIDPEAASEARRLVPGALIVSDDFFALTVNQLRPLQAIVGNP